MYKLFSLVATTLLFLYASLIFADNCEPTMGNLFFYAVTIKPHKEAVCTYRYCYYSCIYDSYKIPGKFKPTYGDWQLNENGYPFCTDSSSDCTYAYANP